VGVAVAVALHAVNVLVVVLAIVAMVMLHELGHYLAAKASGMKVTEYFFGFGPRLWSIRRGETEYGVKAIPAGGYVRITGMTMLEEVADEDEPRSYRRASFPRRLAVAVAGSAMHALIAFALCWGLLVFSGVSVGTRPYVGGLLSFSSGVTPAERAGLRPGDLFVSVDGRTVSSLRQVEVAITSHAGRTFEAVVRRDGHLVPLHITPVDGRTVTEIVGGQAVRASGTARGVIGIELDSSRDVPVNPVAAVPRAGSLFGRAVASSVSGLGAVFSFHGLTSFAHSVATATEHPGAGPGSSSSSGGSGAQPISIVGVVEIGSQAAANDIRELILLLVAVNIVIGLINLFPLLPFDGGHVSIAVYERLRSRKGRRYHADVAKMLPFSYAALSIFLLIGLGALYSNVVNPVHIGG
jgi:membrane-associated protease RseP (regulator of RpoE activity)